MSETRELVLPLPPNMANARTHWRKKHAAKLAYWAHCDAASIPQWFTPEPLSPVVLGSTLHLWATMDDDNALARIKWAADWLKSRRYIVDDKRPHCRFTIPEQVIDRSNQRLVLTITPLTP